MSKHSQPKTGENVLSLNPKTPSCTHPNLKVKNLLNYIYQLNLNIVAKNFNRE
jgi:hypothetical protein